MPDSTIQHLLDLARHAPSSMNGQPWHFVVIRDRKTKEEIAEIKNRYCPREKQSYPADFLRDAPVIIVICVDKQLSFQRDLENSVLAAANLMLAACAGGLGSVYMSAYASDDPRLSEEIGRTLKIPEGIRPVTILPLGYPNEAPEPKELRPLEEVVHLERF